MEMIEVVIWFLIVVGSLVYNFVQQQKKKARQREEAARHAGVDTQASQPVPHPKLPVTYREMPSRTPHAPQRPVPAARTSAETSPWADTGWGRQAENIATEHAEDLTEAAPAPLPLEVPVEPVRPAARHIPPRVQAATPRRAPPVVVQRRRLFRTPKEVRGAIIGMTVLGPCRAMAPYEEPDIGGVRKGR